MDTNQDICSAMLEPVKIDLMILFIRLLYSRVIVGNREAQTNTMEV